MSTEQRQGFLSLLNNRAFVLLWLAETIGLTAQNGIHFAQMIVIERLTGSSTQVGLMILAFSLPGVLFSVVAGVVVDRLSKKTVLVASNFIRFFVVLGYVIALNTFSGRTLLLVLYSITFVSATLGQFLAPAMWSKVPLVVGRENLLPANALFNLTSAISQAIGLIVLVPLSVKLFGISLTFGLLAAAYLVVTLLVLGLPPDKPERAGKRGEQAPLREAWRELREGLHFVASHRGVYLPIGHLTLVATLLMVMGMMAPGFSSRVLGMAPEDAVYIFSPAGVGMLAATAVLGRVGRRISRETWANLSLLGTALAFGCLGQVSRGHLSAREALFQLSPGHVVTVTMGIMGIALFAGFFLAALNAVAQTSIQERSPEYIRGRVYSVQFLITNLVGLPPMLGLGAVADTLGIPVVCYILAGFSLVTWILSVVNTVYLRRTQEVEVFADEVEEDRRAGRCRILIIAPSSDRGAWKGALALEKAFALQAGADVRVSLVDGLDFLPGLLRLAGRLLRSHVHRDSWLWKTLWRWFRSPQWSRRIIDISTRLLRPTFRHVLDSRRPDAVVSFDAFFSHMVARAREGGACRPAVFSVATDLARVHPLWICPDVDGCVAATESAAQGLMDGGMPPAKVYPLGFPVDPLFNHRLLPQGAVRESLNWPADVPIGLMLVGRAAERRFVRVARALARDDQRVQWVIAGSDNQRFLRRLNRMPWKVPAQIYSYVEDLPEFLRAADLVVTRAGSGIIAEALAAGRPLIIVEVPGQDEGNVAFVPGVGVGMVVEHPEHVPDVIEEWFRPGNPIIEEMAERAREVARPAAAEDIARLVLDCCRRSREDASPDARSSGDPLKHPGEAGENQTI